MQVRPSTDAGPPDTDAGPPDTDAGPPDTDAGPPDTDAGPPDTDADPLDTDADPLDTDAGPLDTCRLTESPPLATAPAGRDRANDAPDALSLATFVVANRQLGVRQLRFRVGLRRTDQIRDCYLRHFLPPLFRN